MKKGRRRILLINLFCVALVWTLIPVMIHAAVPNQLNYQGYLTDPNGDPVPDGSYWMTFALYDAAVDGTALWSESQTVPVANGVYNVILGQPGNELDPDDFEDIRYLGVRVESDDEMTPRIKLTSVAFSLHAATVADGAVTTSMIQDDTITADDLGANSVGRSEIAAQAVGTDQIEDGAVNYLKMADDTVDTAKIINGSVSSADVGFNYAGSTSKGGPATDLACAGCVSQSEVQVPFSLNGSSSAPIPIFEGVNNGTGYGVWGENSPSGYYGYLGSSTAGVHGWGGLAGVSGKSSSGRGMWGITINGDSGVYGEHTTSGNIGYLGGNQYGVYGNSGSGLAGVRGQASSGRGMWGITTNGDSGVYGEHTTSGNIGYLGGNQYGVYGNSGSGFAGYFEGMVAISGNVGIGTSVPELSLHVVGPNGGTAVETMKIDSDGESDDVAFRIRSKTTGSHSVTDADTKFIVRGNGNVGIGTSSPGAKLEVEGGFHASGNVQTGGDFLYSTAKTFYLNMPACAFQKDEWDETESGVFFCAGGGGQYTYICEGPYWPSVGANAPVYLPEGATIKKVTFSYYDNDSNGSIGFGGSLRRRSDTSTSYETMASASFLDSTDSTAIQHVSTGTISLPIHNESYQYWVSIGWYIESDFLSDDLRFYGARIEYVLTTMAP